tara:strand:+ start:517 stop:1671 length:1155 start_codon:yes stop_codon:yes gene_type:complete
MWQEVLSPISKELISEFQPGSLGENLNIYSEESNFPDLRNNRVTIIGVPEDRTNLKHKGTSDASNAIRKQLYSLYPGSWEINIADIGNIIPGRDVIDTIAALEEVCVEVIKHNSIPFIIGGSSDLGFAIYRAFVRLEQTINATILDSRISLESDEKELNSDNYLSHILTSKPYRLYNLSHIGHQTYYVPPQIISLLERMHFSTYRLGEIRGKIHLIEPLMRDADVIFFNNHVIRMADAPGQSDPTPNGLTGEEFCAAMRYAGMSDKLSATGLFDFNPRLESSTQNAQLLAQSIWYFFDGVDWRKGDYPFRSKTEYTKFTVLTDGQDEEIIFYKSSWSERWWMEIPAHPGRDAKNSLISCSIDDYNAARKGEIPDRYWKAIQKSI